MCPFFSVKYRQMVRKQCNEILYQWITTQTKFPPHVLEFIIKSFHFQNIFAAFLSLFVIPYKIFVRFLGANICLFCMFVYLDGCVLSNIEYKLCDQKDKFINIIDPFLYFVSKPTTSYNRFYYTLYLAVLYFIGCLVKIGIHLESQNELGDFIEPP